MKPQDKRKLGSSPLMVSQLGFGGAPIGDLYANVSEEDAAACIRTAHDSGLNLFDTAPFYGYGLSEHRFGHTLRQFPRDSFVLSTKVGRRLEPRAPQDIDRGQWAGGLDFQPVFDYTYDGIMREVEHSMMRLGMSRIDVLLIHDVDNWTHGAAGKTEHYFREVMEGGYRALDELRSNGTVKAIGVGINEAEMCTRFAQAGDFDCFILAGRYTLLEQDGLDSFLPLCGEKDIGIMLGGPFNSGILATGPRPGAKYNYVDAPPEILDRVGRIQAVCQRYDVPLAGAAIQFPLGHPNVSSIIPGAVSVAEVQANVELMNTAIPTDLWRDLKHEGLVREDAPTPSEE